MERLELVMIAAILRAQLLSMRIGAPRGHLRHHHGRRLVLHLGVRVGAVYLALTSPACRLQRILPLGSWQSAPIGR